MKRNIFICILLWCAMTLSAQTTTQILDRTASVVGRKGGCAASFTFSHPQTGKVNGQIQLKGQKFHTTMQGMEVWFNGKTQWTYQASTDEVNISTPTAAQRQQMNPYAFITLYKRGYTCTHKIQGGNYLVTLTAQNKKSAMPLINITIRKSDNVPTQIRFTQNGQPVTITIQQFKAQNQADALFVFNSKKYPTAEIIDLR